MYHPRSTPFGDVFQIPTSGIDGIANKVYQEQKLREQQKLQQDKALDDEFAKNVAGVKSADIPDITSAYNDFKQAHINLQKKGNKATPQDQMDVLIKKANAFQAINSSKEDKERIKNRMLEVRADKKGLYNPDAHTVLSEMLNTPTSKRKIEEDDDRLKYKYAMPNIDKEISNAAGKGQEKELPVGVDPSDPLKNKFEVYKTINPPNTFYNNLFTGLASRSDNKGFIRSTMDNLTDDEKEKLRVAYEAKIQDPKFKAIYGDVQPFPASAANTELGQATALKTMEAFVNLPIEKIKDKSVPNTEAVMDKRNQFAKEQQARGFRHQELMEGLRQGNREKMVGVREKYKNASDEEKIKDVDAFIKSEEDEAKSSTTKIKEPLDYQGYKVKASPVVLEAFTDKDPTNHKAVTPIDIYVLDNGNFKVVYPNDNIPDKELPRAEYRAALVNHVFNTKVKLGQINTPEEQKVHTGYSRTDLKGAGWTDDQINKAVKAGKIKLN